MTNSSNYPRDLVGYGIDRPDPQWPQGARLALNFVFNYEEGSEYSIPDGDGFSESHLLEGNTGVPRGTRDLNAESVFEFGSRVGFWRLLRLFSERGLPFTVFGCALALERNPLVTQAIIAAGADICCHGWRWERHWELDEATEREHILRAIDSIARTTGTRPLGWYCRTGPSENTRRLLVKEGGFLYDSDAYNDELPYWVNESGNWHLVIPYSTETNDAKFMNPAGVANGGEFFEYLRDTFDLLYAEGATQPAMMSVGLHMRIAGRPGRAAGLARFLDYVKKHEDIWICQRLDIARHWIATHPAPTP